jgi:hypothetical protein
MAGSNPLLGVFLAMVGCFCSACGYTLQKLAHRRADAAKSAAGASPAVGGAPGSPVPRVTYWRYWQFPAGLAMLIVGSVFAVVVFGLAGQAELAPMGAATMIFNELLAWRVLREPFTRVDAVATLLMGLGTTISIVFGQHVDRTYTLDIIISLVNRPAAWTGTAITLTLMAATAAYVNVAGKTPAKQLPRLRASLDCAGRAFVGGMLGGYTGLCTKTVVTVVFGAVGSGDLSDLARVEPYLFIVALACSLTLQVRFMNSGLARYDSVRVIPVYQSSLVIASVYSGWTYWDEIAVQTPLSVGLFVAGCCLTLAGILVLSLKPETKALQQGQHAGGAAPLAGRAISGAGVALDAGDGIELTVTPNAVAVQIVDGQAASVGQLLATGGAATGQGPPASPHGAHRRIAVAAAVTPSSAAAFSPTVVGRSVPAPAGVSGILHRAAHWAGLSGYHDMAVTVGGGGVAEREPGLGRVVSDVSAHSGDAALGDSGTRAEPQPGEAGPPVIDITNVVASPPPRSVVSRKVGAGSSGGGGGSSALGSGASPFSQGGASVTTLPNSGAGQYDWQHDFVTPSAAADRDTAKVVSTRAVQQAQHGHGWAAPPGAVVVRPSPSPAAGASTRARMQRTTSMGESNTPSPGPLTGRASRLQPRRRQADESDDVARIDALDSIARSLTMIERGSGAVGASGSPAAAGSLPVPATPRRTTSVPTPIPGGGGEGSAAVLRVPASPAAGMGGSAAPAAAIYAQSLTGNGADEQGDLARDRAMAAALHVSAAVMAVAAATASGSGDAGIDVPRRGAITADVL